MFGWRRNGSFAEELTIYVALVAVGAIPVVVALVQRSGLGVEPTIGLLMIFLGILGLAYLAWSRRDRTA